MSKPTNEKIILALMIRGKRYTTTELTKDTGIKRVSNYLAKARAKKPPLVRREGSLGSYKWIKY